MTTIQRISKMTGKDELAVARTLSMLSDDERLIVKTRFAPTTLSETAKRHGVTTDFVREIEARVLGSLSD